MLYGRSYGQIPKGSAPLITFVSGRNWNRKCGRHKA
jgi:hypothetical protein